MKFTIPSLAQQPIQVLHNHVNAAVSSGQAELAGSLPATQILNVTLVLSLRNQEGLANLLEELYDPSSPNFHKFLSVAEFTEQFGPTAEDYDSAVEFAKANGFTVTDTPANRMALPLRGSVTQVEKAFNVKMNNYRHPYENRTFFSPDREPSLSLSVPVSHIAGLDNFTIPHPASRLVSAEHAISTLGYGSGPWGSYIGSDMRAAYYGGTALTGAGQVVGLMEYGGYDPSDVTETFTNLGQTNTVPINNVLLDSEGAGSAGNDDEQVLDIVAVAGMAPGLSQIRVYIGSSDVDMFNKMASENIAKQISISWMWTNNSATDDPIFHEMAAQGQSIFAASGDWGSYVTPDAGPFFPAEDANVTAVGGTLLETTASGGPWSSEVAWGFSSPCTGVCGSGGGISPDSIPIPTWQAGVASAANGGSTTLRNIPDVSMEAGDGFYVCSDSSCGTWVGTSIATPLWAAYTALVNEQAVAEGNTTVGFLDPAIYAIGKSPSYGSDFHDIASGSNGTFNAVAGYDLVTGWGSPNGQNLINALTTTQGTSGSCHVAYSVTSSWSGSFNAAITIYNTGTAPITSWQLQWSFSGNQTITNVWNGTATLSGKKVSVKNVSYNGSIPAGGSYSGVGFTATYSGTNNAPASFTLNGKTCN
ncbi:MAG: cellulose binding domain-containing protein [Terracidiphilus sp.]